MKKILAIASVALVGIGAALTYHVFENAVHGFIDYIWYDTFNTDEVRWLVFPLAIGFSVVFFGLQHYLDKSSENQQEHGLGEMPDPTIKNFLKILVIGFFSLVAGATLGPEAILVPACMLIGAYIGKKVLKGDKQIINLLAAAGLMALFTAFFDSFIIGVLSLLLVMSQAKIKFKPILLIVAIIASAASQVTLNLVEGESLASFPDTGWSLSVSTLLFGAVLIGAGYLSVEIMSRGIPYIEKVRKKLSKQSWVIHSLVAGTVLATLFFIGGSLVEFTGNKSIQPMFEDAASLGLGGLLWIFAVKVMAIIWSKAIGYRGGMIFPTIFLAAVLAAIVQLYVSDFNVIYGIIAVIIGALISNRKNHALV